MTVAFAFPTATPPAADPIAPAELATRTDDDKKPNLYGIWQKLLADADEEFDRLFKRVQDAFNAPPRTELGNLIALAIQKAIVDNLATDGKLTKFEVALVARDPKKPIIYFYSKDGRVIGYSAAAMQIGMKGGFGFWINIFRGIGYFDLKETIGLSLPNGECLVLTID